MLALGKGPRMRIVKQGWYLRKRSASRTKGGQQDEALSFPCPVRLLFLQVWTAPTSWNFHFVEGWHHHSRQGFIDQNFHALFALPNTHSFLTDKEVHDHATYGFLFFCLINHSLSGYIVRLWLLKRLPLRSPRAASYKCTKGKTSKIASVHCYATEKFGENF